MVDKKYFASEYTKAKIQSIAKILNSKLHTDFGFSYKEHEGKVLTKQQGNDIIYKYVIEGIPKMVTRWGGVETGILREYYAKSLGFKKTYKESVRTAAHNNAGIFPSTDEGLEAFCQEIIRCMPRVDMLAFYPVNMFEYWENQCENLEFIAHPQMFEPYLFETDTPWTMALKGKRVLVVHPFEDSIYRQYEKRERLFNGRKILPDFDLRVVKAVQTIAGNVDPRFGNWTEALDYMTEEALKQPFDVAILGCGGYGFPLAARLKTEAGKPAIHIGGATQILFGIKGSRWTSRADYAHIFNENWISPTENEKVSGSQKVEGGCYW